MRHKEHNKVTCVFCGNERTIETITDDGCDYYGHHRGAEDTEYYDNGCDCILGELEQENPEIKMMCLNCKYLKGLRCGNKERMKDISDIFEFTESPIIKNLTGACSCWELNLDIFKKLIKIGVLD